MDFGRWNDGVRVESLLCREVMDLEERPAPQVIIIDFVSYIVRSLGYYLALPVLGRTGRDHQSSILCSNITNVIIIKEDRAL